MYYFKKFSTYDDYLTYKNDDLFLIPNLSLTEDDGKTYYTPYINQAGDVVLYDGEKYITVSSSKLKDVWDENKYTLEGVVVIPNTHTPDGKTRIISLASMDYNNPDTGNFTSNISMCFGGGSSIEYMDLNDGDCFKIIQNIDGILNFNMYRDGTSIYLPSDNFSGNQSVIDSKSKYYYDGVNNTTQNKFIESSYFSDGTANMDYRYGTLNDFNGSSNTDIYLDYATGEDWENLEKLTNTGNANYFPVAETCRRYHTDNTNNWYVPSIGELGYLICRYKSINDSISTIKTICGTDKALNISTSYLWSSSQRGTNNYYILRAYDGCIATAYNGNGNIARAFAEVSITNGIK